MNKPISYVLNKLLIEKGFDYHKLYNDFANEYDYYDRAIQGRLHISDFSEDKFPDSDKWFPVPYVYQVVMWLYEKHNIWIMVNNWKEHVLDDDDNILEKTHLFAWFITGEAEERTFNSPIEAYEAGIEYILTKLI